MISRADGRDAADGFDAEELLALARIDLQKGNMADALRRLKAATRAEKVPPGAFSICGHVYGQLGLWEHASKMFQRHLERQPDSITEKFALGLAHAHAARSAEAIRVWDEVLQKQPKYHPALFYRGLLRAQAGQHAAAKQDLELLLKSAESEDPYLKPARELLRRLEAQQPSVPAMASAPAPNPYAAALARTAYGQDATDGAPSVSSR